MERSYATRKRLAQRATRDFTEAKAGIERLVAVTLYLIWPAFLSHWLHRIFPKKWHILMIEGYVIVCVVLTALSWWFAPIVSWWPRIILAGICSYIALSTVVTLLHVVDLSATDCDVPRLIQADSPRGGGGQIDLPAAYKRPSVVDPHHDASAVTDLNERAERHAPRAPAVIDPQFKRSPFAVREPQRPSLPP